MNKQHNALQQLNRRFLLSLLIISMTIFLIEILVMLLLDFYQRHIGSLSVYQEAAMDALLMALISAPLLWFFVLRKLVVQIGVEHDSLLKQTHLNAELRGALDFNYLVSITDTKGRIIHVNKKFCEVSGYSLEELLGNDHSIVNSGYHDKEYIRNMWQAIKQGNIWQGIFCNRCKNGDLYWVDSTITPLRDEQGQIYQYISIRQDITAQKIANKQMIMLKRAVNASTDMILLSDADGHIQYVNPALCQITGWTETALLGKSLRILDCTNNDPITMAAMKDALAKGESWLGRLLQWRKTIVQLTVPGQAEVLDMLEYWVELNINPVINRDGSLAGYVQIQRDINEQVLGEMARQVEVDDTAAHLAIAEMLQQAQSLEARCSQALEILFGLQALDQQQKGGIFLLPPDTGSLELFVLRGQFSDGFLIREKGVTLDDSLYKSVVESGELLVLDYCFDGPHLGHICQGMKAHGHYLLPIVTTGEVLGVAFLYTEPHPTRSPSRITMLKQVGEILGMAILQDRVRVSLENARDMAMRAALSKSEFLANMSHEIRTPMNGVLGMLDLLRDTDMSNNQWDLLETAYDSAEALLGILNDILDFSKLEAGRVEIEQIDFDLSGLVEDVCSLLAGHAHAKNLELNCFMPSDMPRYWLGDPARIRQVLTNLIGNAVKFTGQGEVSVTAQYLPGNGASDQVRFAVRDTGIGISESVKAQLFQPFSQAESSTSRRFGGTGLGLSICKKMVELMGGEIGLESLEGEGACFWFILPLIKGQTVATENPAVDIIGKSVLVVDDNATNCTILLHYLRYWGFTAEAAVSGQAALKAIHKALADGMPFDVALLDMHMPEMDGLDLARIISETPALSGLARIVLTSGSLLSEHERRTLGLAQILLKPVKQTQLFDAIINALYASGQPLAARTKPAKDIASYEGKKVLVVEDNKVNQKVIIGMLAKFKLIPELADNGKLALEHMLHTTFDLILMDCQMPILDGYQTTRELRLIENGQGLPKQIVVALTANANVGERDKCLDAGMDDYLAKPFTQDQLAAILARWLTSAAFAPVSGTAMNKPIASATHAVWDKEAALRCLMGDEELLNAMLETFLDEAPGQLSVILTAISAQDLEQLGNAAHSLKGSFGYLGVAEAMAQVTKIETLARKNEQADYHQLGEDLVMETNSLMDIFRQFLAENQ